MGSYEQIQGYLHSDQLRWSFGSMRGRESDAWWKALTTKPIKNQIEILQSAGFSGLLINRNGYKDNASKIEGEIAKILNINPIISQNKILSFFKLTPTGNKINIPPVFSGFHDWEGPVGSFAWANNNSKIKLYNNEKINVKKVISFTLGTLKEREMEIYLNNQLLDSFQIKPGEKISKNYKILLEPGRNFFSFETNLRADRPGGADPRKLSFSIEKFYVD